MYLSRVHPLPPRSGLAWLSQSCAGWVLCWPDGEQSGHKSGLIDPQLSIGLAGSPLSKTPPKRVPDMVCELSFEGGRRLAWLVARYRVKAR